jgi:uncharacterized protein YbjT (DUF2867 family)
MNRVILFGGTGHLGKRIAAELQAQGYSFTAVVRNQQKATALHPFTTDCIIADVTNPTTLEGICNGFTIVISALGKSVSLNDKSKPSFEDVDLKANSFIVEEAVKSGVQKFVYVSALGAEKFTHLEYFRVHHIVEEKIKQSGLDFSIIKPPAIFSAFLDLIPMARKGQLMTLGKGDKRTNPIYEGDLAKVCVDAIKQSCVTIEPGGKQILTRQEINHIIQQTTNAQKKVRSMPLGIIKASLPLVKIVNRNMYDKMAFFTEVMLHDTIATPIGTTSLETYLKKQVEQH